MSTESIKLVIFDMAGTTVYDDHYVSNVLCEAPCPAWLYHTPRSCR